MTRPSRGTATLAASTAVPLRTVALICGAAAVLAPLAAIVAVGLGVLNPFVIGPIELGHLYIGTYVSLVAETGPIRPLASFAVPVRELVGTGTSVLLASAISSIAGFAFSPIASTLLAAFSRDPVSLVGLLAACSIAIQGHATWSMRKSVRLDRLLPFILGGLVTIPVGLWILRTIPTDLYQPVLGFILIAWAVWSLIGGQRLNLPESRVIDVACGALGGILGGIAAFPGAPVTIAAGLRGWEPVEQRAVYQPYILLMQTETLLVLAYLERHIPVTEGILYIPVALLGSAIGLGVFSRLAPKHFKKAVAWALLASGLFFISKPFA